MTKPQRSVGRGLLHKLQKASSEQNKRFGNQHQYSVTNNYVNEPLDIKNNTDKYRDRYDQIEQYVVNPFHDFNINFDS